MIRYLKATYYSFPVQLVLLHFKKFQVLLVFWFILFGTLNGGFMRSFGANALFLSPEYLGNVNALSAGIVGVAMGIFIMSWNITTFILLKLYSLAVVKNCLLPGKYFYWCLDFCLVSVSS